MPDRAVAIRSAISNASPGDIVLIAGKGHEDYQDIRGVKYPFDDRRVARIALNARREMIGQRRLDAQQAWEDRGNQLRDDENIDPNVRRWNQ